MPPILKLLIDIVIFTVVHETCGEARIGKAVNFYVVFQMTKHLDESYENFRNLTYVTFTLKKEQTMEEFRIYLDKSVENINFTDFPKIGDRVKVTYTLENIVNDRLKSYQGLVIAKSNLYGLKNITVRTVVDEIGVEQIIPLTSPIIKSVEIINSSRFRRAKILFLRALKKKFRRRDRR